MLGVETGQRSSFCNREGREFEVPKGCQEVSGEREVWKEGDSKRKGGPEICHSLEGPTWSRVMGEESLLRQTLRKTEHKMYKV